MSLIEKILGRRLVQCSTAEYDDGWTVSPVRFLLYENRWGRRSYRIEAPAGVVGHGARDPFQAPVQAWARGGELPPRQLPGNRSLPHRPARAEPTGLSREDREKLAKLLHLLESEHDGEVLSAARAAGKLLKARQASWREALGIEAGAMLE